MRRKVAVARLWYEANSFSPVATGIDAFRAREWVKGEAARKYYAGTATELGGVVVFNDAHRDWDLHFLHCCAAPPGGLVPDGVYFEIEKSILSSLQSERWDAVYMSLHGAMACVKDPTPELRLLRKIREMIGPTPLGASFDLHAHLSREMTECLDVMSGYHTYPHIDMDQAAIRVLEQLRRILDGEPRPRIGIKKSPYILPSFNMRTDAGPMAELQHLADEWRNKDGIWDVCIFGGFAYGDSPFAGPTVTTVAEDQALANSATTALIRELESRLPQFLPRLPDAADGLRQALASSGSGPAIVLDPADNPLSGGIGDTPTLFRALLASPRPPKTVFAFFCDPELVARCHDLGAGAKIAASLGGRVTPIYGLPVSIRGRITRLTDGKYRNEGPMEHNLPVDVGRTAMIEVEGIQVIVTEACQTPNDPAFFRMHGLDPETQDLICVKAKNHFRAAFSKIARCLVDVDTPGPASAGLDHYDFRHLAPGVKPLTQSCIAT